MRSMSSRTTCSAKFERAGSCSIFEMSAPLHRKKSFSSLSPGSRTQLNHALPHATNTPPIYGSTKRTWFDDDNGESRFDHFG